MSGLRFAFAGLSWDEEADAVVMIGVTTWQDSPLLIPSLSTPHTATIFPTGVVASCLTGCPRWIVMGHDELEPIPLQPGSN